MGDGYGFVCSVAWIKFPNRLCLIPDGRHNAFSRACEAYRGSQSVKMVAVLAGDE